MNNREIQDMRTAADELERIVRTAADRLEELQRENEDQDAKISTLEDDNNNLKSEIKTLQARIAELEENTVREWLVTAPVVTK